MRRDRWAWQGRTFSARFPQRGSREFYTSEMKTTGWILIHVDLQSGFADPLRLRIGHSLDVAVPAVNTIDWEWGVLFTSNSRELPLSLTL